MGAQPGTSVNLTSAAEWLVTLHADPALTREYRGALALWCLMLDQTGDDVTEDEVLDAARSLADQTPNVLAFVAPF